MTDRVVQAPLVGRAGRWGNWLLEYMAARAYARRHGATLQVGDWPGRALLGLNDPLISAPLPELAEEADGVYPASPPTDARGVGRALAWTGQFNANWYDDTEQRWSTRLTCGPDDDDWNRIVGKYAHRTAIGVHVRRGDFGSGIYYLAPIAWYRVLLERLWKEVERPMLVLTSDDANAWRAFADFDPRSANDLGLHSSDKESASYFADWWLLTRCAIVVGPSSTFSFTAAMCSACRNLRYYRSSLRIQRFERVDPWNAYPTQRDSVDDFPHVEGIRR